MPELFIHTPKTHEVRVATDLEQDLFFSDADCWKYRDELIGPNESIVGYVGIYE